MATPKNPNVFFVGIQETKDLKRAIIEATRDSVVFLQKYENFLKIRKEKNEAITLLKKTVKEITSMVNQLKKQLPESEIHRRLSKEEVSVEEEILGIGLKKKEGDSKLSTKQSQSRKTVSKNKPTPKESKNEEKAQSEMDKLEDQLKELENRLQKFE
ncbi:MAG: hypothetical protein ACOC32_00115 [Nanoarchaeota archaeon]